MAPKVAITYAEKIYAVPGCEQDFQELLPENITPSSSFNLSTSFAPKPSLPFSID